MVSCMKVTILWLKCIGYSIMASLMLLFIYIRNIGSRPWRPKDRPNPPDALLDPKYGVHKYATVNGIRLHYVEAGDPSKPLMLLVHGFPEFWYCWRHQITEFSKDFWTIAVDLRGYNLTERPNGKQNYKIKDLVEDLRALIVHLNREQCIYIGHDWGAIIGWEFVSKHHDMVQKYVLMGAPSNKVFTQLIKTSKDQAKRTWYFIFFQMPVLPELLFKANDLAFFFKLWDNKFNESFTKDDLEAYKYVFQQKDALKAAFDYYRANFAFNQDQRSNDDNLDGSNGMFILGKDDKPVSPEAIQATAKEYPKIRIEVVAGANHFVQEHAPTSTNALLRDFLGPATNFSTKTIGPHRGSEEVNYPSLSHIKTQ